MSDRGPFDLLDERRRELHYWMRLTRTLDDQIIALWKQGRGVGGTFNQRGHEAISVGAGLYEELVFRMMLIAVIHTLLVDLAGLRPRTGTGLAILISAVAFTWYHPLTDAAGVVSAPRIAFYFLAGLYFGLVYVWRGFGIVVAVHALYDIITVVWE